MNSYVVRFKNPFKYNDLTYQVESFKSQHNLNGISTCDLVLPNNLSFKIEKFDRFQLIKVESEQDIIVFEGYVDNIKATIEKLTITGKTPKELLNYKFVLEDKTYTNITVTNLITLLLVDWGTKTRGLISVDGPEFDTLEYTLDNFTVSYGESIYSVIERLTKIWFFNFTLTYGNTLLLRKYLGTDRTLDNGDFYRLVYNKNDRFGNNISSIESNSTEKYSLIVGRNKDVQNEKYLQLNDTPSMESIGLYYLYESGYLKDSTVPVGLVQLGTLLSDYEQEVRIFDCKINRIDNIRLEIGDKVQVDIEDASDYLNYSGSGYIIGKTVDYINGIEEVTYTFGGGVIQQSANILRTLFQMKGGVNSQKDLKTVSSSKPTILN